MLHLLELHLGQLLLLLLIDTSHIVQCQTSSTTTEQSSTSLPDSPTTTTRNNSSRSNHGDRSCISPEACVFEKIFTGYNRLTRPVRHHNRTIDVEVQMVFNGLMDIEEKDEYMRLVGFFRTYWYDDMLKWDPDEFEGVKMLIVPAQTVWIPDIGIANSVSSFYEITYKRDFHLQVHYNGWIRWSFGGVLTTSCDIDLSLYPFDFQHCSVVLESWQYERDKVSLILTSGTAVNTESAEPDPQWILEKAEGESFLKYDGRFSAIRFTLHWARKPLYFYINIIVPSAFMGLITLGVFWLPAECGEKMSLGITVVLAFSVFQIVIMEITPVSSDAVPKITELVLTVMSLATCSLLSSMVVSYLRECEYPAPWWAKKLFLYYIPKITRMSSYKLYQNEMSGSDQRPVHWKVVKDKDVYKKYFVEDSSAGTTTFSSPSRSVSSILSETNNDSNKDTSVDDKQQPDKHQMDHTKQQLRQPNAQKLHLVELDAVHLSEQQKQVHQSNFKTKQVESSIKEQKTLIRSSHQHQNGVLSTKKQLQSSSQHQHQKYPSQGVGKEREFTVKDIKQILSIMEGMKEKSVKQEEDEKIREEWKYIGRAFDMLIFWICVLSFVGFIVYVSVATHAGKSDSMMPN